MTDATELDEAAVRARLEAATEGPWEHSLVGIDPIDDEYVVQTEAVADVVCRLDRSSEFIEHPMASARADAEFIAHARTDLPAALDEITRLRAALDEARERADSFSEQLLAERHDHERAKAALDEARSEVERLDQPLRSDHPGVINAEKRGYERGWDAAREEFKPRAEAAESALGTVTESIALLLADLAKAEPKHFSIGLMCVRVKGLAALATPTTTERSE